MMLAIASSSLYAGMTIESVGAVPNEEALAAMSDRRLERRCYRFDHGAPRATDARFSRNGTPALSTCSRQARRSRK
jgi:hypothetical protein